jgi:hypothetical protein
VEWLQYAGTAALFACLGVIAKGWFDARVAHETALVKAQEVQVEADKVQVTERTADASVFGVAFEEYRNLLAEVRAEMDERDTHHKAVQARQQGEIDGLTVREQRCREELSEVRSELGRLHTEVARLRRGADG